MKEFFFEAKSVDVGYGVVPVVRQVSFGIKRGEILTIIGENGAGKSTLLKNIMGQLKPMAGTILVENAQEISDVSAMAPKELAQKMAVVLTDKIKGDYMTCRDVVSMGRYPYTGKLGTLSEQDRTEVQKAIDLVGISKFANQNFETLSDGQKQLAMLARALCQNPEILVLDEPTSYLDMRYKLELLGILQQMAREERMTVIMSLHELELAERISDKILCIKDQSVDRFGTPEEIFTGNYVEELFGVQRGSYDSEGCRPELSKASGKPEIFVIGGGGSATAIYRNLQRKGIPFVTGILSKNDIDYPVANALASQVICVEAFEEIDDSVAAQAMETLESCKQVWCGVSRFGSLNRANEALLNRAKEKGILHG